MLPSRSRNGEATPKVLPDPSAADADRRVEGLLPELGNFSPLQTIEFSVRRFGPSVGRFCVALLGSPAEGEEAAQEVFVMAAQSLSSFRGEGTLRSWIFSIARHACARRLETRTRRQSLLDRHTETPIPPTRPDDALEDVQRGRIVRKGLEGLRPTLREVIVLRYVADLSFREIAGVCGIDEATARKRASRGLEQLRELLPLEELR